MCETNIEITLDLLHAYYFRKMYDLYGNKKKGFDVENISFQLAEDYPNLSHLGDILENLSYAKSLINNSGSKHLINNPFNKKFKLSSGIYAYYYEIATLITNELFETIIKNNTVESIKYKHDEYMQIFFENGVIIKINSSKYISFSIEYGEVNMDDLINKFSYYASLINILIDDGCLSFMTHLINRINIIEREAYISNQNFIDKQNKFKKEKIKDIIAYAGLIGEIIEFGLAYRLDIVHPTKNNPKIVFKSKRHDDNKFSVVIDIKKMEINVERPLNQSNMCVFSELNKLYAKIFEIIKSDYRTDKYIEMLDML